MEVGVVVLWEGDVGEDLGVVCPGGRGEVDGCGGVGGEVEFAQEEAAEVVGACAGDGLEGRYLDDVVLENDALGRWIDVGWIVLNSPASR